MDSQTLAALEQAAAPYRDRGFVITSQSEGAITLTLPPEGFSYLFFFITLLVFWPIAVIYLISFNGRKNKQVCVRLTSQGQIEATGYTLEAFERENRRKWWLLLLVIAIPAILAFLLWLRFYLW
jgi:hypothetical protein